MTPDQINIAIAESLGWTDIMDWKAAGFVGTKSGVQDEIPDYHASLDACHEMEKAFIGPAEWDKYCDMIRWVITQEIERKGGPGSICGIVNLEQAVGATAAQKTKAYLKTLNLWKP